MQNAQLQDRDYTVILDKSGSMSKPISETNTKSRWDAVQEGTLALARKIDTFDKDGFTLIPFSNKEKRYEGVTAAKVEQVFNENEPNGSTNLAAALQSFFDDYFTRKAAGKTKPNGDIALVVTDGEPDDREAVVKCIVEATKKMDKDEELGVQIVQAGNDPGATTFLKFLDDELTNRGAKFDIVDTKTFAEVGEMQLADVLLSAITD